MKFSSRNHRALLCLVGVVLTGCRTGTWGTPGASPQGDLAPCSQTSTVFSTSGTVENFPFIDALPAGKYTRSNFEVYVENPTTTNQGRNESQVQVLVQYSGQEDAERASLSLRCRENQNNFVSYSTTVTVPVRLLHYNNGSFDANYDRLAISYLSSVNVQAATAPGGTDRSSSPATLSNALSLYWNSNVAWVRRSGDTFEFHGRRLEGNRRIFGKATFVRRNLPLNSP